jgi:hypothetical protein
LFQHEVLSYFCPNTKKKQDLKVFLFGCNFDTLYFLLTTGVIFVESEQAGGQNVVKNLAIRTLLEENGYIFLEERSRSYWFLHPKWHKIYANVTNVIFG